MIKEMRKLIKIIVFGSLFFCFSLIFCLLAKNTYAQTCSVTILGDQVRISVQGAPANTELRIAYAHDPGGYHQANILSDDSGSAFRDIPKSSLDTRGNYVFYVDTGMATEKLCDKTVFWTCEENDEDVLICGLPGTTPGSIPGTSFDSLKPEPCPIITQRVTSSGIHEEVSEGIKTALGCFPTEPQAIIQWILKYAIIFAGGIGFLLMLFASFQMMTSSGDPEKLKSARGLFSSAIMGILIIIFSLFILRFIGATILKIPGWQ